MSRRNIKSLSTKYTSLLATWFCVQRHMFHELFPMQYPHTKDFSSYPFNWKTCSGIRFDVFVRSAVDDAIHFKIAPAAKFRKKLAFNVNELQSNAASFFLFPSKNRKKKYIENFFQFHSLMAANKANQRLGMAGGMEWSYDIWLYNICVAWLKFVWFRLLDCCLSVRLFACLDDYLPGWLGASSFVYPSVRPFVRLPSMVYVVFPRSGGQRICGF